MKIYEYIVRIKDQATDKLRRLLSSSNAGASSLRGLSSSAASASTSLFELSGLAGMASRYLGPAFLAGSMLFLGKQAVTLAADLEQTQVGFEVMLGSAEKANKMIADIRQFAKVTPFETTDLVKASETMLGFGIAGEKIMPTLKMLGDVSRGNAEKLRLVSLAYSQIQAAGRLMGQDLLQLINAGFNPLQEISQKTGKSMAQLKKEMEAGKISASMVTEAFISATSAGGRFFGMMERQSQTFHGMVSTLRDEWNEGLIDLGQRILPTAIEGVKWLRSVLSDIMNRVDFSPIVNAFEDWNGAIQQVTVWLGELWTAMGLSTNQANVLQYVFNAVAFSIRNAGLPLRFLINLIMLVTESVRSTVEHFKGWGEVLEGVFTFDYEKIKSGFNNVVDSASEGFGKLKERVSNFIDAEKKGYAEIFNTGPKPELPTSQNPFDKINTKDALPDAKTKNGIEKITGGGRTPVNVTINLNNLIGQQNFDVKNLKETVRDMEQETVAALLRVLNSANYAAAQ
jgi:tape measure domain-containing protein